MGEEDQPMRPFDLDGFGVSTNLLDNPADLVGAVTHLSIRFSIIELELEDGARTVLDAPAASEAAAERLTALTREHRLSLSLHAPYVGPTCDLASDDDGVRHASVRLLGTAIRFCADVGASRLTYHPGYFAHQPVRRLMGNLMRSLDEVVPTAQARGVTLCLENMGADRPNYIVFSPAEHAELCEKTGSRLTFDVVHHVSLGGVGSQFFDDLETMLPYVENVHLADAVPPKHVHLPLGMGALPIGEVLTFLGTRGYAGNVIVEETGGGYAAEDFIEGAWRYREGMLAQIA